MNNSTNTFGFGSFAPHADPFHNQIFGPINRINKYPLSSCAVRCFHFLLSVQKLPLRIDGIRNREYDDIRSNAGRYLDCFHMDDCY